jgi:hypothetical protein
MSGIDMRASLTCHGRCLMSITEIWEKLQSRLAGARELDSLDMSQREELARDVGVSEPVLERLFTSVRLSA